MYRDRRNNPPRPAPKLRPRREGSPPKPCLLVGLDGSSQPFESRKQGKRALAALILTLPSRKSSEEPKRYWIRNV